MRWLILLTLGCVLDAAAAEVPVLVYHDIVRTATSDHYAVTEAQFREQMAYLHEQGYQPISLDAYLSAAQGQSRLPAKPVMLTFDDGLASFRDIALPILVRHGYPAVLSVTTGWLDRKEVPAMYRGRLLAADSLRDISRSPGIEILSHSDQLHQGIVADRMGNRSPAAVARRYQESTGYESDADFRSRLRADLSNSVKRLTDLTGKPPRGIVWPYGHYNAIGQEESARLGMVAQLTLDEKPSDLRALPRINRLLLYKVRSLADFEETLLYRRPHPLPRLLEVSLDDLATRSDEEVARWIQRLVGRVRLMRINTVLVNPFSRDGRLAYYSNPSLPFANDRLHAVLHHLQINADINRIYLLLPGSVMNKPAYQELARRHPYDGIVVSGDRSTSDMAWLRETFERYRPGMACGTGSAPTAEACNDFQIHFMTAGGDFGRALRTLRPGSSPYVLVHLPSRPSRPLIESTFRELRQARVRYFGVADRPDVNDPAVLRQLAIELNRHVPRKDGG